MWQRGCGEGGMHGRGVHSHSLVAQQLSIFFGLFLGLSCQCRDAYKLVNKTGGAAIYCEACPSGYVSTKLPS